MKVLVTGSSGFIGQRVCKVLEERKIAYCCGTRTNLDMTDVASMTEYLNANAVSHVIHLAAYADNSDGRQLFESNISGMYRLLLAVKQSAVKYFSFTSSNNVYGEMYSEWISEKNPCQPASGNAYAQTKYVGELLLSDMLAGSGIKTSVMRISDVYGPNQRYGNLIKAIVSSVRTGDAIKLYGEGKRTRDYIYVDDVAEGLVFAAENELEGVFNLATGIGTDVKSLTDYAVEISNGKCTIEYVNVDNEDLSSIILNPRKLKEAGFVAKISVKEGLAACVRG